MKKKILISIIVSVVFLAVLFVPIPGGQMKDGGTKVYSSLTYKIVNWNRLYNDEKYSETKIYFGADAWKSIDELFAKEEPNIKSVVRATVIEIGGNYVLIEPLEGEFECLSSDRISINISDLEDIGVEVGSLVEVTYKGGIMESYPAQINVVSWKKSSMNVLPGGSDVHKGCEHNWERIDNFNEYTAMDKCTKCGNTRKYTDPDNIPDSGYEVGFKMLRYNWNGYGMTTKEVFTCDLGYAIIDCLSKLEETGKIIHEISNEAVDEYTGILPVIHGTLWIECGTVGLFRLSPEMNEICKVRTHLGEGVELKMTDTLEELLTQAWYYFPNDYWSGKYENGTITLNQIYKSDSAVDYVRIDSIDIEKDEWANIKIVLTIGAKDSIKTNCKLFCSNGGDVIGFGDDKEIELAVDEEIKVELTTGGLYNDWTHYVTINIDNTRISLTIVP